MHEKNGQLVAKLEATDPDEGQNGRVIYDLRRHMHSRSRVNRGAGEFLMVDQTSGEVWLKRALQQEDLGSHNFVVLAKDQGTPISRSDTKVIITTTVPMIYVVD